MWQSIVSVRLITPQSLGPRLANLSADVGTDGTTVLGRMEIGIQAFQSDNLEARAQYGLQAGDGYWRQSLIANLIWQSKS
jgi:hypothetical protein